MKRIYKKSLYKIFVSLFIIFYSFVPQTIAIGQVIEEYSQESAAPIVEEEIPEESLLEEEVVLPEEEIPPVVEEPLVEEIPIEEPIIEEEIIEESVIEEPVIEPEEVIKEVMSYPVWVINGTTATTYDVVQLGKTYIAPQNSRVRIIFTKLPENPTKLTIEEITLTQEEIDATGAVSNRAYDIKTDMIDGTFEYDLVLPSLDEDTKVVYVEEREDIFTDVKKVANEVINEKDDTVKVKDLNHFTIFIVSATVKISGQVNGSSQVTVTPGQTITVTMGVELSGSEPNDWHSTQYKIGNNDSVCLNNIPNPDRENDGSYAVSFDIVAPNTIGTYNLRLRAYDSSNCDSNYNERSLLSAIVVANLPPVANPSLSQACGLDIALVIDNSTSIDSGELAQMKTAMTSFTSALNGTPTQFSVVKFGTSATLLQSFTGDISVVNSAINGISLTSSTNYTNWEDGLLKASDSFGGRVDKPNLVIFATDGDPTTSNTVGGININQPNAHLTPAVNQANIIKNNNTRILMLGIGMGSGSLSRLESISGPNDNTGNVLTSDVITTDFSGLAAQLATFATQTCGGTITVRKIINGNANAPLDNWQFTVNGQSYNTDAQGYTVAIPVTSGTYSVMENPVKSGYSFNSATCVKNGNPVGSSVTNGVNSITVGNSDIVSCTFINNYLSICGDTIVSSGEECDDGNSVNTDTCLNSCKAPSCGDGYLYIGNEQCDNGASNTDIACIASYNDTCNYCDNNCVPHTVTGPYCGNGIIDGSETCDGSNLGNYSSNDFQCNQCSIELIEPKVTICHSSSSHSNPYITNQPNKNGTVDGHVSDDGPVWYPGITVQWGDIIPPFAYIGGFFSGLNWSTEGQAIYNNGCNLPQGTLIVKKIITNDNGGNKSYSDFSFNIGVTSYTFEDDGQNDISLIPGKYTVTENTANGYTPTYNNCSNVIVPISGSAICTITNDDIAPKLTLNKIVDNNNGGTLVESAWTLTANGGTSGILQGPGATGNTDVVSGSTFKVGTYTLYESIQNSNYTSSSWSCVKNGGSPVEGSSITLGLEDIATCTITNSDNKPTLTLNKVVVNDNGGTASESAWTLTATSDGKVPEILTGFGASGSTDVVSPDTFKIGTYTLSESGGPSGYSASQWSCLKNRETMPVLGNTITLTFGDTATCTIINDDIAPTLKLTKVVVGGTSVAEDWTLSAGGTDGFSDLGNSNTFHQVKADVIYSLSESGPEGYSSSWWKCSGGEASGNTVKLSLGENVTCTITNTRDTGSVKVNKYTDINGDGDWSDSNERSNSNANTLGFRWSLDSGVGNNMGIIVLNVVTGSHTVDEIMPGGYHFESWYVNGTGKSCSNPDGETLPITLDITKDNTKEITICNARDTGTITIIKDAINNSEENFYFDTNFGDFELEDDGNKYNGGTPEKRSFTIPTGSYWIDERNESGWKLTNLECIGDDNSVINLSNGRVDIDLDYGENVTCTYTNTELAKIWGFKYKDENGNGDWNLGEWGLGNWRIFIDEGNGIYDGTEPSDLTSNHFLSLGYYEFDNLLPGTYSICEELQTGWTNTTPVCRTVVLTPGDVEGLINFSNFEKGDMSVWKYEDTDGILGRTDGEEFYIGDPTFTFRAYKDNAGTWEFVADSSTNGSGEAVFTDVFETVGSYYVCEVKQDGWQEMRSLNNPSNNLSGEADEYPVCEGITVSTSGYGVVTEFGNAQLTDIHGYKWSDLNGDGERNCIEQVELEDDMVYEVARGLVSVCELEPLLPDWTINLFKWNGESYDSEPLMTMDTDDSQDHYGWYWFEDLMPGEYKICEVPQNNWVQTYPINEAGNCHVVTLPDDNPNGFLDQGNAVDGPTYNFGNLQKGSITVYKFNDLNANGVLDEGESYLSDWEMNMSKVEAEEYNQMTGIDGSTTFNLLPDSYVLSETMQDGWDQTRIYCEDNREGVKITLPGCAYGHHGACSGWNKCGDAATCAQKACEANGYQYLVSYGDQRPCTQFDNCSLFNDITYDLSYTADWGNWCDVMGVTDIYCSNGSEVARAISSFNLEDGVYNDNAYNLRVSPGDNKFCYVGNVQRSELYISKTNDSWPNILAIGDTVTYTINVRAAKSPVSDVVLTDLPPEGFIPQPGTFSAISSVRGTLDTSGVMYSSPGKWELGKILAGEIVTITYKALVTDLVDAGKYPDLAYAKGIGITGSNLLAISEGSGFEINDGIVGKYFVGTQVEVENDPEIEEGQVLGASITLPRTGADTYITLGALISMILGFILLVFNPKKRIKNLFIAGVVLFSMFFILKPLPTYASVADIDVRIEQPATPTNKNTFKIGFVALDLQNRTVTVECYKDDILFGTYATNSGSCEVTPALVTTSGTYDFYVKAKAGGDENISSTVSVEVVLEKPLPVVNYLKTEGTCKYTLKFKTANDGRTSKVEIFRSSTQPFTANASTLIDTISVAPNADVSYTDNDSLDCNKEYYYAIRSLDDLGNFSSFVTDKIVKFIDTPISPSPTEVVDQEGEVAGDEVTPDEDKEEVDGDVKGDEDIDSENGEDGDDQEDENSIKSIWSNYKYFIIAALVVALGSGVYTYVRRKR